jgi:hypothetical protein
MDIVKHAPLIYENDENEQFFMLWYVETVPKFCPHLFSYILQ